MKLTILGVALTLVAACGVPQDTRPAAVRQAAAAAPSVVGGVDSDAASRAAYLSQVRVSRLTTDSGQTFMGRVVSVDGEVQNVGTRSVKLIEVTFYFLDNDGQRIYEKTFDPVVVSPVRDEKPLAPHYVRTFSAGFTDVPQEWGGKVEAKVTDVQFADAQ